MRILITAGPTREPIDPVRFISNHSSGRMGLSLVNASLAAGHSTTAILGPVSFSLPPAAQRIDVETTRQMHDAFMRECPRHDLLIMAAAVADYRPLHVAGHKLGRGAPLTIELEPTEDIVATAAKSKRPGQFVIGFALESLENLSRARQKLTTKNLDMIVFNPLETMNSTTVQATLLFRDGRELQLPELTKERFALILLEHAASLASTPSTK